MARILISGVPGTGKTTVGDHLAEHFGYTHVNMEADSFRARRELEADSKTFLGKLATLEDVVLSWGFSPYMDRPSVDKVVAAGYRPVWLDGDHVVTLSNFLARENHDPHQEANYYGQMQMILATEVAQRLDAIQIDTFDNGVFRPVEIIAAEIVERVAAQAALKFIWSPSGYALPHIDPSSPMGKFTQAMKQIMQVPKEPKKK